MSNPTLYVAITNHGFGHTTRMAAVLANVRQHCPTLTIIIASTAPRWLIDSYLSGPYIYRPRAFDIGVVQRDSVTMDKAATLSKLQQIQSKADSIVTEEARFLRQNDVGLVIGDIPPLVTRIAHAANVPCWMIGNFGWDFIYRDWKEDLDGGFVESIQWIESCFQQCDRLFRLPFHEPMSAFPVIDDVGLTGGTPRYSEAQLREIFQVSAPVEKTALLTFGGLGLDNVSYEALRDRPDWQFLTFDHQPPDTQPNLLKVTDRTYRPVDVMPLCGQIVSKPGYSTFSEACMAGVPIKTVDRQGFAEAPILIEGIQRHAMHLIMPLAQLYDGTWSFLDDACVSPTTSARLATDGNQTIANAILNYFQISP